MFMRGELEVRPPVAPTSIVSLIVPSASALTNSTQRDDELKRMIEFLRRHLGR